ncbi:hypothetical protein [Anthocerotibacter panamensis]|uniref:hypothetical protein n=1 Tax=Anthocerotibacter panamensis TaxID=2857077 RepID=UPI001C403E39|nr:hypothetical protein [Anthocerotibacter panamensis]
MTEQEVLQLIAANAQAIQANNQGMAELRALTTANTQAIQVNAQAIGDLRASINDLREGQAILLEGQQLLSQRFAEEQDRREEMRRDMTSMQSQVLGLQTQANRIIERMDRRDRGEREE